MQKIYKEYQKAGRLADEKNLEQADPDEDAMFSNANQPALFKRDKELTIDEKKYLLAVERGDIATVKHFLEESHTFEDFNINAKDPLGRSSLHIAIEYENIEMIELLLNNHIEVGEAILHAINEEFVEAVEMLLNFKDRGKITNIDLLVTDYSNTDMNNNDLKNKSDGVIRLFLN